MLIQYPECNLQISDKALSALTAAFRCKYQKRQEHQTKDVQKKENGYQMDLEVSISAPEI